MAKAVAITDQCPIEIGLNILGGKWKLKILWQISKGAVRFNELQRRLGKITTKTLTQQLRELESHLSAAAGLARSCGLSRRELEEMLVVLLEEE